MCFASRGNVLTYGEYNWVVVKRYVAFASLLRLHEELLEWKTTTTNDNHTLLKDRKVIHPSPPNRLVTSTS